MTYIEESAEFTQEQWDYLLDHYISPLVERFPEDANAIDQKIADLLKDDRRSS